MYVSVHQPSNWGYQLMLSQKMLYISVRECTRKVYLICFWVCYLCTSYFYCIGGLPVVSFQWHWLGNLEFEVGTPLILTHSVRMCIIVWVYVPVSDFLLPPFPPRLSSSSLCHQISHHSYIACLYAFSFFPFFLALSPSHFLSPCFPVSSSHSLSISYSPSYGLFSSIWYCGVITMWS